MSRSGRFVDDLSGANWRRQLDLDTDSRKLQLLEVKATEYEPLKEFMLMTQYWPDQPVPMETHKLLFRSRRMANTGDTLVITYSSLTFRSPRACF
jgi:hypothetical protein